MKFWQGFDRVYMEEEKGWSGNWGWNKVSEEDIFKIEDDLALAKYFWNISLLKQAVKKIVTLWLLGSELDKKAWKIKKDIEISESFENSK